MKLVRVTMHCLDPDDSEDTDSFSLNPAHIEAVGRTPDYVTWIRMVSGIRYLVEEAQHEVEDQMEMSA